MRSAIDRFLNFHPVRSGRRGELVGIEAPMGAGKSGLLVGAANEPRVQAEGVILFMPRSARRTKEQGLRSRTGAFYREAVPVSSLREMAEYIHAHPQVVNILIDEFQFVEAFPNGLHDGFRMARAIIASGRNLTWSGLPLDFRGDPFDLIARLTVSSDRVQKPQTDCRVCHKWGAIHAQRLEFGQPVPRSHPRFLVDSAKNIISGIEYKTVCGDCHVVLDGWNAVSVSIHRAIAQARRQSVSGAVHDRSHP